MKVLHLPTSVGGNSWGLAQAEKLLGIDSKVLITHSNWLNYSYDICLNLENKSKITQIKRRIEAFLEIRKQYDVYHFNFGSSLIDFMQYGIHLLDLPFYNGKKVITYNGCDARLKYSTISRVDFSACHQKDCYGGVCNSGKQDKLRLKRIQKVSKYIDHIFSLNPDLMHFLPDNTTFLPYSIAGWDIIRYYNYKITKKIKIIHSPTNRGAKGSNYILEALNRIKKKYNNIEITIVENVPYEKALKLYSEAHIVIDQILIGWYGAFGVEAMKMGKPLAVFIREEDLKFIPKQMAKEIKDAIININPFNIEKELEYYIENPEMLIKKSQAVLDYVYKWHNPVYVGTLTKEVYEKLCVE